MLFIAKKRSISSNRPRDLDSISSLAHNFLVPFNVGKAKFFLCFENVFATKTGKDCFEVDNVAGNWEKQFISISLLLFSLRRLKRSVVTPMGTVICHPSTDIAAQCSACLPKSFGSKRGTRWWRSFWLVFRIISQAFHLKTKNFRLKRISISFTQNRRIGIWSFPLTTSQSDDSVYKLAVSDFEATSLSLNFRLLFSNLNTRSLPYSFFSTRKLYLLHCSTKNKSFSFHALMFFIFPLKSFFM